MLRCVVFAVVLVLMTVPAMADNPALTQPDPSLSPRDVVNIQMEALRNNDTPYADRGIQVTFYFASPANKRVTGPLERFAAMVRNPVYGPMINHRAARYENLEIDGDTAHVDVILMSRDGEYVGYHFGLSRQHGNPYEGSWMTDSVVRFEVVGL